MLSYTEYMWKAGLKQIDFDEYATVGLMFLKDF